MTMSLFVQSREPVTITLGFGLTLTPYHTCPYAKFDFFTVPVTPW